MAFRVVVAFALIATCLAGDTFFPLDPEAGETWNFPMTWTGSGNETQIRTQSMCDGASWVRFSWNKTENWVKIHVKSFGLPDLHTLTRAFNPSTAYNTWPQVIENAKWQFYIISNVYQIPQTCYYDPVSLILLGTDYDHYGNVFNPATAYAIPCNAMSMLTTPKFRATPPVTDTEVVLQYADMRDEYGHTGALLTTTPWNLNEPYTSLINLYTNYDQLLKPVPTVNFGTIIANLNNVNATYRLFGVGYTLTPDPKPDYLVSRDNTALGWYGAINGVPSVFTDGAQCAAKYQNEPDIYCGTFQMRNFYPLGGC